MVKTRRVGNRTETEEEERGRQQTEVHTHKHEVKYRDKSGHIRDYVYNYGKVGTKSKTLKILKKR